MTVELILSFLSATVLLAFMPGPDNIFVLTESLANGFKSGFSIVLGLCCGVLVHVTAAATGLSLIIQQSDTVFSLIKYFGVAYLLYLAFLSFKNLKAKEEINLQQESEFSFVKQLRTGFFMNVLNPKVALFFIAFLPQFITTDSDLSVIFQMMILGSIFIVVTIVVFGGVALLAGKLHDLVRNPKFWIITNSLKTIVLLGMAVALIIY